jgi:maltose/moltooligosaccharide transporter
MNATAVKPQVTFWQIWNMCFGFLGLQFGFALQNANVSRIFQTLGAKIDDIPILWIAAPLTGLLVQPIVGYYSDRTWNRLGRRRPYFLAGAILASLALIAMPRSPVLWMAAGLLWILDASINIAMEPFRAFVGDQLPEKQRPNGYLMQSFFIGVGSVVASALPWIFARAGVSNVGTGAGEAAIPDTVRYSFEIGAIVLLVAILWTIVTTREYPPSELHGFSDATPDSEGVDAGSAARARTRGLLWFSAGAVGGYLVWAFALDQQLYLLCGGIAVWGLALVINGGSGGSGMFRHAHARHRQHASAHAAARAGAVLLVAVTVLDVDLHDAGRVARAFRCDGHGGPGVQRRRQLGRRAVRCLQRLRGVGGHRDSVDGAQPSASMRATSSTWCWAGWGWRRSP